VDAISKAPVLAAVVAVVTAGWISAAAAAEPGVTDSAGVPLRWSAWIDEHAPVVVVLWASWTPEADATIESIGELARVARSRDFELVLVSVQEDAAEARSVLADVELTWLHDRYGDLLKMYRVVAIPRAVIIDAQGTVVDRIDADPMALRSWESH
jgi:hypothetical protein